MSFTLTQGLASCSFIHNLRGGVKILRFDSALSNSFDMKQLKLFLLLTSVFIFAGFISCSKNENTPVDQYVELIEEAIQKLENIKSSEGIENIANIMQNPKAQELDKEYADYVLTEADKKKLKKSLDKLIHVAYDKTMEYAGLPENIIKLKKAQVDMMVEAANQQIDNATTLGEIGPK